MIKKPSWRSTKRLAESLKPNTSPLVIIPVVYNLIEHIGRIGIDNTLIITKLQLCYSGAFIIAIGLVLFNTLCPENILTYGTCDNFLKANKETITEERKIELFNQLSPTLPSLPSSPHGTTFAELARAWFNESEKSSCAAIYSVTAVLMIGCVLLASSVVLDFYRIILKPLG